MRGYDGMKLFRLHPIQMMSKRAKRRNPRFISSSLSLSPSRTPALFVFFFLFLYDSCIRLMVSSVFLRLSFFLFFLSCSGVLFFFWEGFCFCFVFFVFCVGKKRDYFGLGKHCVAFL